MPGQGAYVGTPSLSLFPQIVFATVRQFSLPNGHE